MKLLVMSFESSCGFLFNLLHYYYHGGCQYVKGTKQTLIAVCQKKIFFSCSSLLPLFCLCTLPPCILTPLPLVCWPGWFSGCSSIIRMCNSCVVHVLSNWRFMRCTFELFQRTGLSVYQRTGWSIFSSLVKVKIHLHNAWHIYKMSNRNV